MRITAYLVTYSTVSWTDMWFMVRDLKTFVHLTENCKFFKQQIALFAFFVKSNKSESLLYDKKPAIRMKNQKTMRVIPSRHSFLSLF